MSILHSHNQQACSARPINEFDSLVARGALHEVFSARPADAAVTACFTLGLVKPGRLIWLRHELAQMENGALYAPGLASLGHDPSQVIFLVLRDAQSILQAGLEAVRTNGLSAVVIELWGMIKVYDLTASRKLALAAKKSGIKLFVITHAAEPLPSAAETRWQVKRLSSRVLEGHAPGLPALEATLLRHRAGAHTGQAWSVEWNNEKRRFEPWRKAGPANAAPLLKPMVSLPQFRKIPFHKAA
jgi:protein ImuA